MIDIQSRQSTKKVNFLRFDPSQLLPLNTIIYIEPHIQHLQNPQLLKHQRNMLLCQPVRHQVKVRQLREAQKHLGTFISHLVGRKVKIGNNVV